MGNAGVVSMEPDVAEYFEVLLLLGTGESAPHVMLLVLLMVSDAVSAKVMAGCLLESILHDRVDK